MGPQLLVLRTAAGMGLLGLTLAIVGLYSLVAYSVACRTREIGIRMAMGAGRASLLMMVLRQGMALAIVGMFIGGVAAVAMTRLLTSGVAGLAVPNAATYVVVPILLIGLTPPRAIFRLDGRRLWIRCVLFGVNRSGPGRTLLKQALHDADQFLGVDRFRQVLLEAGAQSAQAIFGARVGGQGHCRNVSTVLDSAGADLRN
jgi:hypothetical protein